jgi:squalene cyclase
MTYLKSIEPHPTNESLVLRLMLSSADEQIDTQKLREQLLARQNPDGGWSNRYDVTESDAFATGQALYALVPFADPADDAIQRACHFLIESQQADGSWVVPAARIR